MCDAFDPDDYTREDARDYINDDHWNDIKEGRR